MTVRHDPNERTTTITGIDNDLDNEAIHRLFGLSYSHFLVLHRTLMQSMPADWQRRAVAVFEELEAAFEHVEKPAAFIVTAAIECTYHDLNNSDMLKLGITHSGNDEDDTYYDKDGVQHQGWERLLVPAPGGDPVPHYNRGRTRIQPKLPGA